MSTQLEVKITALGTLKNDWSDRTAQLSDLESKADCVLYTYGSGGGMPTQETPAYMLELAEKNPGKTYEMIHCDPAFDQYILETAKKKSPFACAAMIGLYNCPSNEMCTAFSINASQI